MGLVPLPATGSTLGSNVDEDVPRLLIAGQDSAGSADSRGERARGASSDALGAWVLIPTLDREYESNMNGLL